MSKKVFAYVALAAPTKPFCAAGAQFGRQIHRFRPPPYPASLAGHPAEPGSAPATSSAAERLPREALRITGQSLYSAEELIALTGFKPGVELTLTDLRGMATKISDHYHRHGYFVAQAYVPPQDIKDGAVTIAVSEGRYGNVTLNNTSNLRTIANGLLSG